MVIHTEETRTVVTPSTTERTYGDDRRTLKRSAAKVSGASVFEAIGGAGAVVLAVIGLAGTYPFWMMGISVLCAGGAMALGAIAVGSAYKEVKHETGGRRSFTSLLGGSATFEFLAGAAAVALAIIALVGFAPKLLLSISVLCLGGGLLIGSGALAPFTRIGHDDRRMKYARGGLLSGAALSAIAGAGAVVLGILGIIGVLDTWTLPLVAMLAVGGALFLSGTALGGEAALEMREARQT